MTVPRADSTMAVRVKKLEDELRRIKIAASITQSAVAPSAVAKNSLWLDSSAGNEPKVFDGTAWVPVRDETIAVAQQSADTAQAAVNPLVPLTDLAAVTTGTTITGATNVTTDTGTGAHVVINDPAYPGQIALYSGNSNEITPALVKPILGGANYGVAQIRGPILNAAGQAATLTLEGYNDGLSTATLTAGADGGLTLQGDHAELLGFGSGVKIGSDRVAGLYFSVNDNAITEADLSSLTNTFPTFPYYSAYLAASATPANATSTAISWTDDAVSPSSGITRSGSVFTVPTAGRYRVTFQAYWAAIASPAGNRLAQLLTGAVIGTGTVLVSASEQPSATAASSCLIAKTIRLAAGAQIRTQVSHTQVTAYTNGLQGSSTGDLTYVQIEWVGP